MTEYITRPGGHDPTYQGPYTATDVNLRLYILPAQHDRMAATLDRYLNSVSTTAKFVPFGSHLVACFAALGKVVGADARLGWMREVDAGFYIPAVRFEGVLPTAIVFFGPYLFVNIPQAVATGREVHGYRKDFGTSFSDVDIDAHAWVPSAADLTHIDAWAVPADGDRLRKTRLIDVAPPPGLGAPAGWPTAEAALLEILDSLIGGDLAPFVARASALLHLEVAAFEHSALVTLFKKLLQTVEVSLPMVFLRQFRDSQHTVDADVQAVLQAKARLALAGLSGHKLPGPYSVTFHSTVSHPFFIELGLPDGVPVASALAIEANCQFVLEEAE